MNQQVDLAGAVRSAKYYRSSLQSPVPRGGFFNRDAVERILAQPRCVGVRYYYAPNDDGIPVFILVGVDGKGQDLQTGSIAAVVRPCPPFCGGW